MGTVGLELSAKAKSALANLPDPEGAQRHLTQSLKRPFKTVFVAIKIFA